MNADPQSLLTYESDSEQHKRKQLMQLLRLSPIPDDQLLGNMGLYLDARSLSRILFMDFIYRQIIDVQGVVMDFGTRWGHNMALFCTLRSIYEPFNRHRKVVGFDTFTGFPSVTAKDGDSSLMYKGNLAVADNYPSYLQDLMTTHEALNPLAHIRKFGVRAGDAVIELKRYLEEAPETIVALAYFDFDIYEPTKKCLEMLLPRMTKGTLVGFDELNDPDSPGETLALMETIGLNNIRLKRFPYASRVSYFVME
jgi:hypothetical protein